MVALEGLDDEQRAAAVAVDGPVCIIAGAGTGKTRTVTHRLAHGVSTGAFDQRRALAITHSKKAAAELRGRLAQLGVQSIDARTFHSAGLRVATEHWALTGRPGTRPSVLPEREERRLFGDVLRRVLHRDPDNETFRDVRDEVAWARSRVLNPETYAGVAEQQGRGRLLGPDVVARSWELFASAKAKAGKVDFADLLEVAACLIEEHRHVAEAVRQRWTHVTVDEYQDTDPAQQRLLEAIVGEGRDICVVGDPRQAIYSWKGADPSYLTGFTRRYPGAKVFDLTRNYRSTPDVLAWGNMVAREPGTKQLVATRPAGAKPSVTCYGDEQAEADAVVRATRKALAAGTALSEVAVLYRFNATQARFEAAFARAGIATVAAEGGAFFQRDEVRAVLVPFGQEARLGPTPRG